MFNPSAGEYFADSWQTRKASKLGDQVAMSVHYMRSGQQGSMAGIDDPTQQPSPLDPRAEPQEPPVQLQPDSSTVSNGPTRGRSHRSPTQKTMLSKALAKANSAVLLDNAQNIEGAIEAYDEACELLQQVMVRSSDLDDRKKLSAIRSTYSNRIAELHDLDEPFSGLLEKALPDDPPYDDSNKSFFTSDGAESEATDVLKTVQIPPRGESLLPEIFGGETYLSEPSTRSRLQIPSLNIPMESQYMPPPLSPRRPLSPVDDDEDGRGTDTPQATKRPFDVSSNIAHYRGISTESTSWLDTYEDASSSARSSRLSSMDVGIRDSALLVDDIGADLDAALDAAVDAAWDDSLNEESTPKLEKTHNFEQDYTLPLPTIPSAPLSIPLDLELSREYDEGNSSDEEERLLEEMTKGYIFDDFSFDDQSKSALPRQSDSSTVSARTWTSSVPSAAMSNMTTLTTLMESQEPASEQSPRPIPPAKNSPVTAAPTVSLPPAPTMAPAQPRSRPTSTEKYAGLGLRERRFSGHGSKQLKIETFNKRSSSMLATKTVDVLTNPSATVAETQLQVPPASSMEKTHSPLTNANPVTPMTSIPSIESVGSISPLTPPLTQGDSLGSPDDGSVQPPSPSKLMKTMPPSVLKKNLSSSSLRMRNLSVTTLDNTGESPLTPITIGLPENKNVVPPLPSAALPTPSMGAFGPHLLQTGGYYLFEDHIRPVTPKTPTSPTSGSLPPPQQLESCPEPTLLRPFWLMRCLYQALAHPRGGYVTTKLFIPRDIWRVRNVKLKALDDKISQCDNLITALLKLAKVDTLDADAVLEELQSFESIIEQVRTTLQKKLGNEVGFSGSSNLFKNNSEDQDATASKSSGTTAKSSIASSWRKLRSKSSAPAMGNQPGSKEMASGLNMSSLPMTMSSVMSSSRSHANRKLNPPPTPSQLPNVAIIHATYMSTLARLFDAAQVLDGIARQVEDPGLKCSSKTQVGLELGVKNAAEFFAFFIIRFVMTDLSLLLDKFLKRGSEWVVT